MLIAKTIECRLVPSEWLPHSRKNPDPIATASNEAKQFLLQLCVASTHLCQVLNDLISTHDKFETWKANGNIPDTILKSLWNLARSDSPYEEMPERFSRSAWLRIKNIYSGWFKSKKKLLARLNGLNRWLSIVKSDQELVEISGCELDQIQLRANELISEIKSRLEESKQSVEEDRSSKTEGNSESTSTQVNSAPAQAGEHSEQNPTSRDLISELFNTYFSLAEADTNLLDQCAIVHLIKNGCKISVKPENPKKFICNCRTKQKQVQRIEKQLKARLPQVRDLGKESMRALSDGVQIVAQDNIEFVGQLANLQRASNPVPYPISFYSSDDLEWYLLKRRNPITQEIEERIFVKFKGLKKYLRKQLKKQGANESELRKEYVFEVCCNRRQHHIFQQFLKDWQIYYPDRKQFSVGLFLLRSASLCWREATRNGTSEYQLYLQCTIDNRCLTSEGAELAKAEEISKVKQKLSNYETKQESEDLTVEQQEDFKRTQSQLNTLNNPFPRPSKPSYKGKQDLIVGISFSLDSVVTVAVVDCSTKQVLAYRSTYQLLGKDYRLLAAYRLKQRRNANERHKQQQRGKVSKLSEANRGKHIDRKLAKAILEVVQEFKASSLALPQLTGLKESIQSKIEAEAELKHPGDKEKQAEYRKQHRINVHNWSYRRLTQSLKERASKIGVLIEDGQQSFEGDLKSQAVQVALIAYSARGEVGS